VKRFLSIVETRPDKDEFDFDNAEKSFNSIHILNRAKAETSFTKAYIETILHFHHFIELTIKELLRRQNELLPYKISKKKGMLDKILNGEILNPHENEKHSLGFSDSLELMKELMNRGKFSALKNYKLYFEDEGPLCELNLLRNRLVHRDSFLVRYTDLDILVGKNIFPFILKLLDLPIYKNNKFPWRPKQLHCKIDPIQKIIDDCNVSKPNFSKIAFLKEMGRAAYKNPLSPKHKMIKDGGIKIMEERAQKEKGELSVKECPVCGANSVIRETDYNSDSETQWVSTLNCICCSFEIDSELSEVSLEELDAKKYWQLN
jgi:hypothetical protein